MKTIILSIMTAITSLPLKEQTDIVSAEQTIIQFVKATDERDAHGIFYLAHGKFQGIFMLNGSKVNSVVNKGEYMKMLWEKKLGGDEQHVEIFDLEIAQHVVSAKVRITNNAKSVDSIYNLYRDGSGWQVLYILPHNTKEM
jgi:hypothetical protein